MDRDNADILVIGAGIFGATAAVELCLRGHKVAIIDEGAHPHPLAATTDISKVIRMEYGTDEQYMAMVEDSIVGFREWNNRFEEVLYHETGVTMFTREAMEPGGFEYESYQTLLRRGHTPERLGTEEIARRFPAWKPGEYVDGFFHAVGGYGESGRVLARIRKWGESIGVRMIDDLVIKIDVEKGRAVGVLTEKSQRLAADHIVVAAGSWAPNLVPELVSEMKATGHPVFHLKIDDHSLFTPPVFGAFTADVARTGWYGFPYHPLEGVIKIANHGVGVGIDPVHDAREVTVADEQSLRHFLSFTFPALADAPIVFTRLCLYCDTRDEHLWIDHHPGIGGLTIASGGSGHGFKFAPVLGPLIADAVESKSNVWLDKFQWRTLPPETSGEEAARYHG
ncbi:MAG: FAD-dependent oxidoreductase [Rhodothermia bacterium]|nr:MAG: FAD-dependent oxidoreductase [Rhodothermia bacterium]